MNQRERERERTGRKLAFLSMYVRELYRFWFVGRKQEITNQKLSPRLTRKPQSHVHGICLTSLVKEYRNDRESTERERERERWASLVSKRITFWKKHKCSRTRRVFLLELAVKRRKTEECIFCVCRSECPRSAAGLIYIVQKKITEERENLGGERKKGRGGHPPPSLSLSLSHCHNNHACVSMEGGLLLV